jgi:sulfur relay (sulfurtransferase) DsrF/TusC family protein
MKFCCVIHSANKEAIDCILAASAWYSEVTVILMHKGIALQQHKTFKVLSEYAINQIYCVSDENLSEVKALLQQQDRIIHF